MPQPRLWSRPGLCSRIAALLMFVLLVGAIAFAAACRPPAPPRPPLGGDAGTEPPQGGAASPDKPRIVLAEVRLGESGECGGQSLGTLTPSTDAETIVGTHSCWFGVHLEPVPSQAWYDAHVSVTPAENTESRPDLYEHGWVELRLPGGRAGDLFTVTLSSVLLPGSDEATSVTYQLRVSDEPRAVLQVSDDGRWREVQPGEVLRMRPLLLRVGFTKPMERETVERSIYEQLPELAADRTASDFLWPDWQTVEFKMAEPPAAIRVYLREMRDTTGLWCHGGLAVAYTGETATLHAWRPDGGDVPPPVPAPADIRSAVLNAAGTHVLVNAVAETTGFLERGHQLTMAAIDLRRGSTTPRIAEGWDLLGWKDGDSVVVARSGEWAVFGLDGRKRLGGLLDRGSPSWMALSPDGRKLAGLVPRYDDDTSGTYLVPTGLAVVDLATGSVELWTDFTRTYVPPMEWYVQPVPAWSPDGRLVAGLSDTLSGGEIRIAELGTDRVTTAARLPGVENATTRWISWSPDGHWWLAGGTLVDVASGAVSRQIAGPGVPSEQAAELEQVPLEGTRHLWSADARYVAYAPSWPMWTWVVPIDGLGRAWSLGPAQGAGWTSDGTFWYVSWPDYPHGYDPWGD